MNSETSAVVEKVQIVKATKEDVPAILSMIAGLAQYEHFEGFLTATSDNVCEALFGPRPAAEVLLAIVDGTCAGFAVHYETFCSVLGTRGGCLDHLYVVPEERGRGVGQALMQSVASIARERHYGRLEWMVLDWNVPAVGFYEHLGAEFLVDWRKFRMDEAAIHNLACGLARL